jgi:uncharacterized protein (TIGR03118 family)
MRVLSSLSMVLLAAGTAAAEPAFEQIDLVSDLAHRGVRVDPNLQNPWGLARSFDGPWRVANNGTNTSTVYRGDGAQEHAFTISVPGSPTGEVFNESDQFPVCTPRRCSPSQFIFAGEDGVIAAYAIDIPRPGPSTDAFTVFTATDGAVYKGLAQVHLPHSVWLLYATDFHNNKVDVFNGRFEKLDGDPTFVDPELPAGYAPFGIFATGERVYVTYAVQDAAKHDDDKGPGHGIVDEYTLEGFFIRHVALHGALNSPWGMSFAPSAFDEDPGALLIGNFGDGRINVFHFESATGSYVFVGPLRDRRRRPIEIDGLWSIKPGNDGPAGSSNDLYFTAGIKDEAHGLFGLLRRAHRW